MSKRLVFWYRVALGISIMGAPFWSAAMFFFTQGLIRQYPSALQHPDMWGTIAAICVLILPLIFAEALVLSFTKTAARTRALYKVLEVTCWLGAIGAVLMPLAFCIAQDVGHIAFVYFQATTGAIFAAAALYARMREQSAHQDPAAC